MYEESGIESFCQPRGGDDGPLLLYQCGRLFNQLRWYREETVLTGGRRTACRRVSALLGEMEARLRRVFPDARALPLIRHVITLTEDWEAVLECEDCAELYHAAH